MLQTHLELLHNELSKAVPDKRRDYRKLLVAAEYLASLHRGRIDDKSADSLVRRFETEAGAELADRWHGTSHLLVAAVADEVDGLENVVERA